MTTAKLFATIDPETRAIYRLVKKYPAWEETVNLLLVPITERAWAHVQRHGGAPSGELSVSRTGVRMRDEE